MNSKTKKCLGKLGYKIGNSKEFLKLSKAENEEVQKRLKGRKK